MTSYTKKEGEKTLFSILFAISFAHLLNDMMQSIIPSIYPIIKDKYGFSFGQIGMITLVFQMTSSLLQPACGTSGGPPPDAIRSVRWHGVYADRYNSSFHRQPVCLYHNRGRCHRNGVFDISS